MNYRFVIQHSRWMWFQFCRRNLIGIAIRNRATISLANLWKASRWYDDPETMFVYFLMSAIDHETAHLFVLYRENEKFPVRFEAAGRWARR